MPEVRVGDEKIYYTDSGVREGEEPVLVLVHGAGETHAVWPKEVRDLSQGRVLALDLPEHGRSEGRGRTTVHDYSRFVLRFLDALGLEDVVVGGHSMGGAITLDFALHEPARTRGVVLVATGARLRVTPKILEPCLDDFEQTLSFIDGHAWGPGASLEVRDPFRQQARAQKPRVVHGDYSACHAFDLMTRLGEITAPALVLGATDDQMTPLKYSNYLQQQLPQARLVVVEGAGHMVMLEEPHQVRQAIGAFLSSL
jgi:pimeloyl-ACP methyl ester carboxylesterase